MTIQATADWTLAYYEKALFENPNLVSIGLCPVRNAAGDRTTTFILEAKVLDMEEQISEASRSPRRSTQKVALMGLDRGFTFVPSQLPIPGSAPRSGPGSPDPLPVLTEEGSEVVALALDPKRRPAIGGSGITARNAASSSPVGTLGGRVTLGGTPGYFLSCWHVLDTGQTAPSVDIIQPSLRDLGNFGQDEIARLHQGFLSSEVDAALGVMEQGVAIDPGTLGFDLTGRSVASVGLKVKSYGRTPPRLSKGEVLIVNASVRALGPYPGGYMCFSNQIQTKSMATAGDSGSLLVGRGFGNPDKNKVVGLTFAGSRDGKYTYHNHIDSVRSQIKAETGKEIEFY